MHYTDKDRADVARINTALVVEMATLRKEGLDGSAKAIEDYLAKAPFDSRIRLARILATA